MFSLYDCFDMAVLSLQTKSMGVLYLKFRVAIRWMQRRTPCGERRIHVLFPESYGCQRLIATKNHGLGWRGGWGRELK